MPVVGSQRPNSFDSMHVQRGQIGPGAAALVLVLHPHGLARAGRQGSGARARAPECWSSRRRRRRIRPHATPAPARCRAYRSRMRPALAWNCGSRGKIQQRCCQGRIASSCSQRQTVLSLIRATNRGARLAAPRRPRSTATAAARRLAGNSQASALISTTSSGGKSPGATRAGPFFQARQSLLVEALSPHADHLAPGIQSGGDLIVAHPLGRHENHLGPLDLEVRQRILCRPRLNSPASSADRWMTYGLLLGMREPSARFGQDAIRDRTYQPYTLVYLRNRVLRAAIPASVWHNPSCSSRPSRSFSRSATSMISRCNCFCRLTFRAVA